MRAIEVCRSPELGGHIERCQDCAHTRIAYNSCRNRHCPKCQWSSAQAWLAARDAELLPVPYLHFVFKLPAELGPIALQNKKVVYDMVLKSAAEALITIAKDPKYLGARIGITGILHTWGRNLQHHPHAHLIVPSGGISSDGKRWIICKPIFGRSARHLSAAFRRLVLKRLSAAFDSGKLQFFADLVTLKEPKAFAAALAPLHTADWPVYAKEAFGGPKQALAYLSQFTHRVAITNNRLVDLDDTHVAFHSNGEANGQAGRVVRLAVDEFIRRFLLHVLPAGFQRIRHFGFLANGRRAENRRSPLGSLGGLARLAGRGSRSRNSRAGHRASIWRNPA
jgi:hypothetical protein